MTAETTPFGALPKLAWIAVDVLTADPRYQRTIESRSSRANITRIVERFSWALFGAATVADTPDGYRVIDGQHRIEAARRLEIAEVPCLLVEALDLAAQAQLFVDANRHRVGLTALAMHHAMVAAGDTVAVAIQHICAEADVEILRYPVMASMMKPRQLQAVGSLSMVLKRHGADVLRDTLMIVARHWPEPGGLTGGRIRGVAIEVGRQGAEAVDARIRRLGAAKVEEAADGELAPGQARFALLANAIAGPATAPALPKPRPRPATVSPADVAGKRRHAPLPEVAPDRVPDEIDQVLTVPVLRRCQRCPRTFKTRHVQQYFCETCAAKERA